MQRNMLPPPDPHAKLQALQSIESSNSFPIYQPAFATQEHPDAQVPKTRARMGQISNAHPQCRLILGATASIPRGSTELGESTGPRTTHRERPVKPLGQLSAAGGP